RAQGKGDRIPGPAGQGEQEASRRRPARAAADAAMRAGAALRALGVVLPGAAFAGAQIYEPLAAEVRAGLQASIADKPAPQHGFKDSGAAVDWLSEMSHRLGPKMANFDSRVEFLRTVHFEAIRAR